ncbi:unnamed protein product [Didymodactylos carnosus]|uniref:Uncharacterized protein n=1 Tax=Didymodactylos carnosus TaxID=1234261 RepID=A0A8S2WT26_9BILA|nr:unnamed protein product [Didymodactylos carnosus]CAF3724127.1 unnamed protein product [Didymodactylos carnosus]CAF4460823.1 unnamed protein product [Didymodactylos carnosus]
MLPSTYRAAARMDNFQIFQDMIDLTGPAYFYDIPQVNKVRLYSLLEFYSKWKTIGYGKLFNDFCIYGQSLFNLEIDNVPSFQLLFWPCDMQPFLDRLKQSRPHLYDKIQRDCSMHLISKWSEKTAEIDQDIEFRYSYSSTEIFLAKQRTTNERILNGVARSIYYAHLKLVPSLENPTKAILPSYFVKTTVLWMCELMDLNENNGSEKDETEIARRMGGEWINFACNKLRRGVCQHYFIDEMNILDGYSTVSLLKAAAILDNVKLDDKINLNLFIEQDKLALDSNKNSENWLRSLKIADVLRANEDYKQFRQNWLEFDSSYAEGDITTCFYILNQLRTIDGEKENNLSRFPRFK